MSVWDGFMTGEYDLLDSFEDSLSRTPKPMTEADREEFEKEFEEWFDKAFCKE